jgi:hypothetical protein
MKIEIKETELKIGGLTPIGKITNIGLPFLTIENSTYLWIATIEANNPNVILKSN